MQSVICWTDIPVLDLNRAIGFYSAVLAAEVTKQAGPGFEFGMLPHAENNVGGCLVVGEEHRPSLQGPLVYLSVAGRLDAALETVIHHGGQVLEPKHSIGPHGFRAVIVDSEGNKIALHSLTE